MKLGAMQPYFFPYIGYFDLINRVDKWIVFDVVDYQPKSWMNRNRILHPTSGWQYISVPVRHESGGVKISDARLTAPEAARTRILGQLMHYRRRAPQFDAVYGLVELAFARLSSDRLAELNVHTLAVVCEYLGVSFEPESCSGMELDPATIPHPGRWALEICKRMGADEYVNPPGGRTIFIPGEFSEAASICRCRWR